MPSKRRKPKVTHPPKRRKKAAKTAAPKVRTVSKQKRSRAAKKAWATRKAKARKRSQAAAKGWATRRVRAAREEEVGRFHGQKKKDRRELAGMIERGDKRWINFLETALLNGWSATGARNEFFSPKAKKS